MVLDLRKLQEYQTWKLSYTLYSACPLVNICVVCYPNQDIDTIIFQEAYSDFTSFKCVCACVCGFIQFYHMQIYVISTAVKIQTELFSFSLVNYLYSYPYHSIPSLMSSPSLYFVISKIACEWNHILVTFEDQPFALNPST